MWDDVEVASRHDTCAKAVKLQYYPYEREVGTATANDTVKFGTYTRDAATGLDYAMNRYYMSTWGRFTTADPYRASGGPANPSSWNRYAYVGGDPVNYGDPSGLNLRAPYPPGYCPAEYDSWECTVLGFIDSGLMDGGGGGGGGGGYDACQTGPGFLPSPGCMMPIVIAKPPKSTRKEAQTDCEIQMYTESLDGSAAIFGTHQYLSLRDRNGQEWTIEGGPERYGEPFNYGKLIAYVVDAPRVTGGGGRPWGPHFAFPNWIVCDTVDRLISTAKGFRGTSDYSVFGTNSNSFMHWLLQKSGLGFWYQLPPPGAGGWFEPIPGNPL